MIGCDLLGFNFDTDGDGFGAGADREGGEIDDVADLHWGFEIDAIDRGGDPAVFAVTGRFDKGGLIDVREDDAAEYGAVVVGVFGLCEGAERQPSLLWLGENWWLVVGHIERIRGLECQAQ